MLVTRLFGELERRESIFDLPRRRFVTGDPACDLSVSIHGHRASTPLGPAAGPNTQLAQNIALSWLAGGRVMELKTVQVRDDLHIPRPCIDMATVGLNVEWSQELSLRESLEEYVKGAMLVEMMKAAGLGKGLPDTVFDMSVGYDLAGIRTAKVRAFLDGMLDARALVDRFRAEIPAAHARYRDLAFPTRISDTLTLSTFHGCPPDEIERICEHLLDDVGLHVSVKLNPMLLGERDATAILRERLGYQDLRVPPAAFARDTRWEQMAGFVERLGRRAEARGLGLGVKFTNTLIVENHKTFFPATEKEMYLSGTPLHVLAIELVRRFRRAFGDRYPISFSAGIDAQNFPDAVALGLKPATVCTDFLKPGGYGRGQRYFTEVARRMKAVGARDVETFTIRAYGHARAALETLGLAADAEARCRAALDRGGDLRSAAGGAFEAWVSAARVLASETYADQVLADARYAAPENAKPPKKVGSKLALLDCLTCDKCIPVCPNDANFTLPVETGDVALVRLVPEGCGFVAEDAGVLRVRQPRQIANLADACNECGNCDVMCPEDGGPYVLKPRFFGTVAAWSAAPELDGFAVERTEGGLRMHARFAGRAYVAESGGGALRYAGDGFDISLDLADPAATARGRADGPVDLGPLHLMERLRAALAAAGPVNYIGAALADAAAAPAAKRAS